MDELAIYGNDALIRARPERINVPGERYINDEEEQEYWRQVFKDLEPESKEPF
jgi:hypothetical protein